MKPLRLFLATCLLLLVVGCQDDSTPKPEAELSASGASAQTWFPLNIGDQEIRVQVMLTNEERARGLMYRQELAENDGMLFVFERPEPRGFWMRNVDLPLDVGYILPDGVLREVYPMYPHVETPVKSASGSIKFALEMNQDWYKNHKVYPGEKVDMQQVIAAIKARGFKPADYAIAE